MRRVQEGAGSWRLTSRVGESLFDGWHGLGYYVCWPPALLSACDDEPQPATTTPTANAPAPESTPTAMSVPTPEPITTSASPAATSTRLSRASLEQSPVIVKVIAAPGSNAMLVLLSEFVHVRGDIWLDTSGGPTANADGGGSRTLMFEAGDLTGTVEVHGVGYGPGAALRDIHGNDAQIGFQPMRWTIGDKPLVWDTSADASACSGTGSMGRTLQTTGGTLSISLALRVQSCASVSMTETYMRRCRHGRSDRGHHPEVAGRQVRA